MFTLSPTRRKLTLVPRSYQTEDIEESFRQWDAGITGTLTRIFTGGGKCLGKGTPVLMFDGTIKSVEDIRVGDLLMGPDSSARRVLTLAHGESPLFRIVPRKGDPFVVNEGHVLTLKVTRWSKSINTICGLRPGEMIDIPLDEYLKKPTSFRHVTKGVRTGVEFTPQDVPLDPYFLGVWLGDGTTLASHVTTADEEIVSHLKEMAAAYELTIRKKKSGGKSVTYCLRREHSGGRPNQLLDALRELNVIGNKHVPHLYKANSRSVRLSVLAGLLDTDGSLHHGGYDFISKEKVIADDVAYLSRSLGFRATVAPCKKTCGNNGVVGDYWRVSISGDCSVIPLRIARKRASVRTQVKDCNVFGFDVVPLGVGEYFGFNLSGDGRFLLGDFTVTHNTPVACMCLDRWLERGDEYRGIIISYEQQLVWQFAQEIEAFMGITPAIEMGTESVTDGMVPQIVVASRQSLAPRKLATQEQRDHLATLGILDIGLATSDLATSLINQIRKGLDKDLAVAIVENHNANQPIVNQEEGAVSRIYKYPNEYNWLVIVDEAHKSSLKKTQTAHWFNWFGKNPQSRRKGLTATPKRSDKVSLGTLFHGVTIDYPLYSMTGRCAVKDGYAVPYVQKYIEVEGVDFKQLKKVAGDYDENELERVLAEEHTLASFCGPTLDLVGDRRTLVFSPTVAMAQAVTGFINARTECKCHACNAVGWYPRPLIGDGAACRMCNSMLHPSDINEVKSGPQAACVYGDVPKNARKETYRQHQEGTFQFLSVCGLCREGYNDPDVSCVAVFRPVSKEASSLAEQMKGRASRPLRGLIEGMATAEERLEAIRTSRKPDALIVDLVGITGLADCATTIQIYAEGLPDNVIARAEEIALTGGVPDIQEAIQQAQREDEEEKERKKQERLERHQREQEEADRRSKAMAEVRYTEHERGTGTYGSGIQGMATEKQLKYIHVLGMDFNGWEPTLKQAGRMITQLNEGMKPSEVAYKNNIAKECWSAAGPSVNQMRALARMGINAQGMTPKQVHQAFDTRRDPRAASPAVASPDFCGQIQSATGHAELTEIGLKIMAAKKAGTISDKDFQRAVELGREQRSKVF